MTDQTIWELYYEPFDSSVYLDNLQFKTIHQLIIEKKIINELEVQLKQYQGYFTIEQHLSYNRLIRELDNEYPVHNTTDKEKEINKPNRKNNCKEFRNNCINENRYKTINKQIIFKLIDTLIEQKKTYNPSEKIVCECGGHYLKCNYVRHLNSKKHLIYLTNLTE